MTSAPLQSHIDEIDQLPLARIDAQEESFIIPLREYLETHGCLVALNSTPPYTPRYNLIAGSVDFVKRILAHHDDASIPTCIILVDAVESDAQLFKTNGKKIVITNPTFLSPTDVEEIFSFFFLSDEQVFNKRRTAHEPYKAPYDANTFSDVSKTQENNHHIFHHVQSQHEDTLLSLQDQSRIQNIMTDVFHDEHRKKSQKRRASFSRIVKKSINTYIPIILLCISICVLPVLCYIGSISITTASIVFAAKATQEGAIDRSSRLISFSSYWHMQSNVFFSIVRIPGDIFGGLTYIRSQERYLSFLSDVSKSIVQSHIVLSQGKQLASSLLSTEHVSDGNTSASNIEVLRLAIVSVHESLGLSEAELSTLIRDRSFPFSFWKTETYGKKALDTISAVRKLLSSVLELLTVYPRISGFRSPQTYLVLFQNSNELRPTGGFIGSVGVASFENGMLADFSIEDVYALDGQLKGHVDPPKPIAELLGQEHWYLRDSNWDPDFAQSARKASWFYEKETGKRVDGVIAINVPVVTELLKATGPITLPDYNDRITQENFFGKSLYYTQANFFPGSTQKKDFLGSLFRAIVTSITTDKDVDMMKLYAAFSQGILQRDILMQFDNPETQSLIEYYGWGGRVSFTHLCKGVDPAVCTPDPFLISEANMSVSKVNNFIRHEAVRDIVLSPSGEISESVSYTIHNGAHVLNNPNEKGVGGPYQTYIRFFLPGDSLIQTVTVDGIIVQTRDSKQKTLPQLPYIENVESLDGTRAVGVALVVSPGSQKQLRITYIREKRMMFGKGGGYLDGIWYKHPGVGNTSLRTVIRYPIYWIGTNESLPYTRTEGQAGSFLAKEGEFEYNNQVSEDTVFRLKFIQ